MVEAEEEYVEQECMSDMIRCHMQINPNNGGRGEPLCLYFFQIANSPRKNGSWGLKFLDFSQFLIM